MAATAGVRAERRKSSAEAYFPLASVRPRRRNRASAHARYTLAGCANKPAARTISLHL
jgi:hypothetical protein